MMGILLMRPRLRPLMILTFQLMIYRKVSCPRLDQFPPSRRAVFLAKLHQYVDFFVSCDDLIQHVYFRHLLLYLRALPLHHPKSWRKKALRLPAAVILCLCPQPKSQQVIMTMLYLLPAPKSHRPHRRLLQRRLLSHTVDIATMIFQYLPTQSGWRPSCLQHFFRLEVKLIHGRFPSLWWQTRCRRSLMWSTLMSSTRWIQMVLYSQW